MASKNNDLDSLIGVLNDDPELVTYSETDVAEVRTWIPTLIPQFDYHLVGGIPATGQVSEIFGKESSGKSTFAATVMKNALKMGFAIIYFDVEQTETASRIQQLGIDTSHIITMKPKRLKDNTVKPLSVEVIGQKIIDILAKVQSSQPGRPVLFIWDSIAQTQSEIQADTDAASPLVGQQAKALATVGRKIQTNLVANNGALLAFNQARDDFNAPNPKYKQLKTTGGKSWDHLLSTRISFQPKTKIMANSKDSEAIGNHTRIRVPKSKVGDNFDSDFEVALIGKWGYDFEYNMVLEAQNEGLISTRYPKYVAEDGVEIKGSNILDLVYKFKDPENIKYTTELWQKILLNYFPQCYPPLFNTKGFMSVEDFPVIKGLRKYYIEIQNNLPEGEQTYNYKDFMRALADGDVPDTIINELKEDGAQ